MLFICIGWFGSRSATCHTSALPLATHALSLFDLNVPSREVLMTSHLHPILDIFLSFESSFLTCIFSVITDPEDPQFDLEKLIAKWETDA